MASIAGADARRNSCIVKSLFSSIGLTQPCGHPTYDRRICVAPMMKPIIMEEIVAGFLLHQRLYPQYASVALAHYRERSSIGTLCALFPKLHKPKRARYLFAGNVSYFEDIIELTDNSDVAILTTGIRTHLRALKRGKNSHFIGDLYRGLYGLITRPNSATSTVRQNVDRLATLLRKMQPLYVFVQSDTMPLERSIIIAARLAGITTVCVQHGLFTRDTPRPLAEGKCADIFLTYDSEQAAIVKEASPRCKVLVSGSLKRNTNKLNTSCDTSIVFVGQPYPQLFGVGKGSHYVSLVESIELLCKSLGIQFWYKPHPGEHGRDYLREVSELNCDNIEIMFERFHYFIGLSSTLLHQASIRGRVAIQVIDPALQVERYSDNGYCYSIGRDDLADVIPNIKTVVPYNSKTLDEFEVGDLTRRWERTKDMLSQGTVDESLTARKRK